MAQPALARKGVVRCPLPVVRCPLSVGAERWRLRERKTDTGERTTILLDQPMDRLELRRFGGTHPFEADHLDAGWNRARADDLLPAYLEVMREARRDRVARHMHLITAMQEVVHGLIDARMRFDTAHHHLRAVQRRQ